VESPGSDDIPYGSHLCNFYAQRRDLIDSLVPFFEGGPGEQRALPSESRSANFSSRRGRRRNDPIQARLGGMIQERRIRILDAGQWYRGRLPREAVDQWLKEEEQALAAPVSGLRVSGNTSFVTRASGTLSWPMRALNDGHRNAPDRGALQLTISVSRKTTDKLN